MYIVPIILLHFYSDLQLGFNDVFRKIIRVILSNKVKAVALAVKVHLPTGEFSSDPRRNVNFYSKHFSNLDKNIYI